MAILWDKTAQAEMLCIDVEACASVRCTGRRWHAPSSSRAARVRRQLDEGVWELGGGLGGVRARGACRVWSGSTGTGGVRRHRDADPGTVRASSRKLLRVRWLRPGTGVLSGLRGSSWTCWAKPEPCTILWVIEGVQMPWHGYV